MVSEVLGHVEDRLEDWIPLLLLNDKATDGQTVIIVAITVHRCQIDKAALLVVFGLYLHFDHGHLARLEMVYDGGRLADVCLL